MSEIETMDLASDTIVAHVEAGRDVRVAGGSASARLDEVGARLEGRFNVVRLTAPTGGLSLSALIGQLSGREKFDEQDDGALEAGFRRLSGADAPDRVTVLLLDATQGVQRPVLRYLQQVGRTAPGLRIVIASFPELESFLEAPDMARLRERLATVVQAGGAEIVALPGRALMLAPAAEQETLEAETALETEPVLAPEAVAALVVNAADAWALETRGRAAERARRRTRRVALMWTVSGLAMAASVVVGAWLGLAQPPRENEAATPAPTAVAPVALSQMTPKLPLVAANVVAPPLAGRVAPAPAVMPAPVGGAAAPGPALAKLSAPEPVESGEPPAAVPAKPERVVVSALETAPVLRPHVAEPRRVPAGAPMRQRTASRMRGPSDVPRGPAAEEQPLPYYGVQELPPEEPQPPAPRARLAREPVGGYAGYYGREVAAPEVYERGRYEQPSDGGYIGTYSTGPYGARVFRYGP